MNLKSLTREEIGDILKGLGQPAFSHGAVASVDGKGRVGPHNVIR